MSSSRPPLRSRPVSRLAAKQGDGSNTNLTDGRGLVRFNLLMYFKNLQKTAERTTKEALATEHNYPEQTLNQVGEVAIGVDYGTEGTTLVFGNKDARELLEEFDDTVDYARGIERLNLDQDALRNKFAQSFGQDFVENKNIETLIDLSIFWAQRYMMSRVRTFHQLLSVDATLVIQGRLNKESDQRRNKANVTLHYPILEEDVLWVVTRDIDKNLPLFTNTRYWQERHFEAVYRLRVNEAIAIIHESFHSDGQDGTRSPRGNLFCDVVDLVNRYTQWRLKVFEVWLHRGGISIPKNFQPGEKKPYLRMRRFLSQRWKSRDGDGLDTLYENFLQAAFNLLEALQTGQPVTQTLLDAYHRDRRDLTHTVYAAQKAIYDAQDSQWAAKNLTDRFPFTAGIVFKTIPTPSPTFPAAFLPARKPLEFPRQPLVMKGEDLIIVIQHRRRGPRPPNVAPPTTQPPASASGRLARAVSGMRDDQSDSDGEIDEYTLLDTDEEMDFSEDADEDEDEEDYYYQGLARRVAPPLSSSTEFEREEEDDEKDGGKRKVTFADEELPSDVTLAALSKRFAPFTVSDLPPYKRHAPETVRPSSPTLPHVRGRRMAISE
ncbi:hypothetical protein K449DRAFT_462124 [Hypoxylon sp. EC38]|nr:hypothetical protein K449DRAFT_462124 [Hypoxylon sp. EC38]